MDDRSAATPLFAWLRDGLADRLRPREAVALLVALDSRGTTGDQAVVRVSAIAQRLGLSERQVYRHVAGLCADGLLTPSTTSAPGRAARYRLTLPRVAMSGVTDDTSPRDDGRRSTPTDDTSPRDDVRRTPDTFGGQHLTLSGRTPDTSPPEDVGVLRYSELPPVVVDVPEPLTDGAASTTPTTPTDDDESNDPPGVARITGERDPRGAWAVDIDYLDNPHLAPLPGARLIDRLWWVPDVDRFVAYWRGLGGDVDDSARLAARRAAEQRDAEERQQAEHAAWLASPEGQAAEAERLRLLAERQAAVAQAIADAQAGARAAIDQSRRKAR